MSTSVLIIDGDPTFADNARQALEEVGLEVDVRFDASLDELRMVRPQILILSAELPRGSGFGVCSRLRRDRALREIAILMTTDEATDDALARHARSAESADDYIRKDIPTGELVDRVGRLLQQQANKSGPVSAVQARPQSATAVGPVTDRFSVLPPPLPPRHPSSPSAPNGMAEGGPRSAGLGGRDSLSTKALGPSSGTAQLMLDLWPREALDGEFRQTVASHDVDPQPQGRATPEQRLLHLRTLVKQHETREKAIRQLWTRTLDRGQDLARRLVTASADLVDQKDAAMAARDALEVAEEQRDTVRKEFETFEEEIRRIFSEKDREEQNLQSELAALKAAQATLAKEARAAGEQRHDDERRLVFLQEELDSLTEQRERAQRETLRATEQLETAGRKIRDLTARLETAEHVAKERADALANLGEQLDELTDDRLQLQNTLEAEKTAAIERAVEAHQAELGARDADHRESRLALEAGHRTRVAALEAQLKSATQDHQEAIEDLRDRYEQALTERAQAMAGVEAERDELQQARDNAVVERDAARGERAAARENLDATRVDRDSARDEAADLRATVEALREASDAARAEIEGLRAGVEQGHRALEDAQREAAQRDGELQQALEIAQVDLTDARAALDRTRSTLDATEAECHRLQRDLSDTVTAQTQLEERARSAEQRALAAEQRAGQAEERAVVGDERAGEAAGVLARKAEQIADLGLTNRRLEQRLKDAEALLEAARRRLVDGDEAARKREDALASLEAQSAQQQAELQEAQQIQTDLESQVDNLARERSALLQRVTDLRSGAGRSTNGALRRPDNAADRRELERGLAERDEAMAALRAKFGQAIDRLREAEQARAVAEEERRGLTRRQALLTEQFAAQEDQLNESRFATESIRNALEALMPDVHHERRRPTSPQVTALLDRMERVINMSLEAIDDVDGRTTEQELQLSTVRPAKADGRGPFDRADDDGLFEKVDDLAIVVEEPVPPTRAGGSAAGLDRARRPRPDSKEAARSFDELSALPDLDQLLGSVGVIESEDEGNVTEVIDMKAAE